MNILAIDPGPEKSAFVVYNHRAGLVITADKLDNSELLKRLAIYAPITNLMILERIASFGMPVGEEVFETVFWSGRFAEQWWSINPLAHDVHRIKRHEVKMHLCHNMRARDANIRRAIIDKLGAPGTKKNPGKTYGISKDMWSALAIALTFAERKG